MYEPLHHKYRPQTFEQLVGQGAIADTLTNALQQNRIAPAYLFCGPRGTGKTSSARILAKSLNCLTVDVPTAKPCGECDVCQSVNRGSSLDIVEIDAASNTGVDNIRELIERSQFAPVQCRYKVYVIDECHMLSTAAFNALLKTLEEPPDRVVFVLATTDPQRVLPTIISRCQRFDFRRIPLPSMIKHLQHIATEENIAIAPSAIQLVAQISQGGLRDAESLLDQLSLQAGEISVESVWDLVGAVPERDLLNLVRAIAADDGTALLERVRHLMDKGREPLIVLQSLVGFYRDLLIAKRAPTREDLVAITPPTWAEMTEFAQQLSAAQLLASQQKLQTAEVQVKNTTQPRLWLEVTLTGLLPSALGAMADLSNASPSNVAPPSASPTKTSPEKISPRAATPTAPPASPPPIAAPPAAPSSPVPAASPISAPAAVSSPVSTASQTSQSLQPQTESVPQSAPSASLAISPLEERATVSDATVLDGTPPVDDADAPVEQPPPPDVSFGSLGDLWNKVLAVVVPRATQIMMSQQGILLGFDGVSAKVGCRSAGMQKLIQSRVPNLEAAFESIFQRKIKVSLELLSAEELPSTQVKEPPPAPPAPPVKRPSSGKALPSQPQPAPVPSDVSYTQPPSASSTSKVNDFVPNRSDSHRSAGSEPINNNSAQGSLSNSLVGNSSPAKESVSGMVGATQPPAQALSISAPPSVLPSESPSASSGLPRSENMGASRLDAPTDAVGFDQDQEKVKRFANFFNGEIVNLDDSEPSATKNEGASRSSASKQSPDPGPDVPF